MAVLSPMRKIKIKNNALTLAKCSVIFNILLLVWQDCILIYLTAVIGQCGKGQGKPALNAVSFVPIKFITILC